MFLLTDSAIIETIKTDNKKLNNANIFIFALLLVIEAFVFYIVPLSAGPGDEMGVIFFNIIAVVVCSFLSGFLNLKLLTKLIFVPLTIALFVPSSIWIYPFDTEYTLGYSAFFAFCSFIVILITTSIQKIIIKLNNLYINR